MVKVSTTSPYAAKLERAMSTARPAPGAKEYGARSLAKDMRPDGVESMRRLIRRFLSGERTPGPQVAGEIVAALKKRGADTAELETDDDEEAAAMYRDLVDALSQLDEIRRRLDERMGRGRVAS